MDAPWWMGDEPDPYADCVRCDECGDDCGSHPVELPFGVFCTNRCAETGEAKFEEGMKRRGFMEVQPDLLLVNPFGD